ncbi:biotin--protein ligase-like isoform X2 [Corticium candelabrum]|nr:biotin--protein ligase-like isoform X2 [Corticium candelabrum]
MESSVDPKPPNLLIYSGTDSNADNNFRSLSDVVRQVVDCTNRYTLYQLPHKDVVQSAPWADNTVALMVNSESISASVQTEFAEFAKSGGRLLAFGPSVASLANQLSTLESTQQPLFMKDELEPKRIKQKALFNDDEIQLHLLCNSFEHSEFRHSNMTVIAEDVSTPNCPVVMKMSCNTGVVVLSLARLDLTPTDQTVQDIETFDKLKASNESRLLLLANLMKMLGLNVSSVSEAPPLTKCFLACTEMCQKGLTRALQRELRDGFLQGKVMSMRFSDFDAQDLVASDSELPVVFGRDVPVGHGFDWQAFEKALKTRVLGRALMYTQVIKSTQTLLDSCPKFLKNIPDGIGVAAVAQIQTSGRGRGSNLWLSPLGCMMVSIHLRVLANSPVFSRITFLQHVVALAAVHGIRSLPGYEEVDLRLKWPNDIYYGRTMKLGGVLVSSLMFSDMYECVAGCGMNVSNSNPTICINDIIEILNRSKGLKLPKLTVELALAQMLNTLECLLDQMDKNGVSSLINLYYRYWIHGGSRVSLQMDDKIKNVTVTGIDEHGFLLVKGEGGESQTVMPDGNSFDALRGLITVKQRT